MRTIHLQGGHEALVDDADYEALARYSWHVSRGRGTLYAKRSEWSPRLRRVVTYRMHRDVLGVLPGVLVDHVDRNGLNNTRENLRVATCEGNARNRKKQRAGSSRFKGVHWFPQRGTWRARLRQKSLGLHATEEDAARAYDAAARAEFGSFARLNFPQPGEQAAVGV